MDYIKRKDTILTDFYNSGVLKIKIDGYYKGKLSIPRQTKIAEEIYLETLYHLANYNAEKLVNAYDENPKSIEMISVKILKRQMMHKAPKKAVESDSRGYVKPISPNNSFGTKLLFGSNYFGLNYISPTDTYNDGTDDFTGIPIPDTEDGNFFADRDYSIDRWQEIQKRLAPDEVEFITALWNGERFYKRKPTNEYKEYRTYIYNKIIEMDLNKPLTELELIKAKLSMKDVQLFNIMFDDDLSYTDKQKALGFSESKYLAQRRILLKKIKALKGDDR
ncbi:hypothetical protein ACVW0P_004511 [Mucilaginibacter sp. UYNi724]